MRVTDTVFIWWINHEPTQHLDGDNQRAVWNPHYKTQPQDLGQHPVFAARPCFSVCMPFPTLTLLRDMIGFLGVIVQYLLTECHCKNLDLFTFTQLLVPNICLHESFVWWGFAWRFFMSLTGEHFTDPSPTHLKTLPAYHLQNKTLLF